MLILPRAQTTFLRCSGWVSSEASEASELPGRLCSPHHQTNFASWEGKEQPPPREEMSLHSCRSQLLLRSRCAAPVGQALQAPAPKHSCPHQGALPLQRVCCAQQASSISEFQQPRSFTSLCKSLLSLD